MIADFVALIFPNVCLACGKSLFKNEQHICTYCCYHLPKTNYHLNCENPVSKLFWGRVPIISAAAFYNFNKGSKVQNLIHQLKYKGQKQLGVTLGRLYGQDLKYSDDFNSVTSIIPVPLHPSRQKKRGYNQSEYFARGIAESLEAQLNTTTLYRVTKSTTQTKKSRFSRWQNVESIFEVKNTDTIVGSHVLLVDDVITTGATLEACAQTLSKIDNIKISIATIAYASHF